MEASPYKKDFPPFLIMRSFQRASRQRRGKQTSTAVPLCLYSVAVAQYSKLYDKYRDMYIPSFPEMLVFHYFPMFCKGFLLARCGRQGSTLTDSYCKPLENKGKVTENRKLNAKSFGARYNVMSCMTPGT